MMPVAGFARGLWGGWESGDKHHRGINAREMSELGFLGASLVGAATYLRLRLSRKSK
jgi:hypothetical protein